MNEVFTYFVLFALQAAGVYAVAASGLVVTYATSGVFNFAHGAVGMFAAFVYWELSVDRDWPVPVALLVVLVVLAPAMGLLLERGIMRRLAGASTVTTIVVTIGLLVALVALAGIIWPQGTTPRTLPEFFEGDYVRILDVRVSYHALIILGAALVVAVALRFILYRTRVGVAMRAVVDDRELGSLTGVDPNRVATLSWVIGSVLAALAGILIAPTLAQFTPVVLTLLVISAYAAAMVGRLRSLPLTFLGALILGEFEYLLDYISVNDIGGQTVADLAGNLKASAPAIMLFLVLVFLPEDRPPLGARRRSITPRPALRSMAIAMVLYVAVAFSLAAGGWVSDTTLLELGKGIALGVVMLSLVLLTGFAGQMSLAQLGFAGLGAIAVWKLGPIGGTAAGIVLAGVVGALVALPALRMRGLYLALATMAFALFLERNVYGDNSIFDGLSGFAIGNASAERPPGLEGDTAFFTFMAVCFGLVAMLLTVVRNGPFGRRLQAMKDSPAACATLGLDLTATKLQVFALASAVAGLGGALLAMWKSSSVGRNDFALLEGPLPGLPLVLIAVVGGITSVGGAVFGSVAFPMLPVIGTWYAWLQNAMALTPGLAGIGLGQNQGGVAGQVAEAMSAERQAPDTSPRPEAVVATSDSPPPERMGLDGPFTAAEVAHLDAETGLSWSHCAIAHDPAVPGASASLEDAP